MIKCPKCGGNVEVMVEAVIFVPSGAEKRVSKELIRRKDVSLTIRKNVKIPHFCKNPDCDWSMAKHN